MFGKDSKRTPATLAALATSIVLAGCSTAPPADGTSVSTTDALEPVEIVLMTHDSFVISEALVADFANETGIQIKVLRAGDAGAMVNQAVLTKDNPLADVIFGVDNNFLSRALDADVFDPYESPLLASVPDELEIDPRVTPIDFGDVCINWDKEYFFGAGLTPPATLLDLTDPAYRGLLIVQNPATSSPGLAFLYSTIARFGETGDYTWIDYWSDLRDNGVLVTSGWEEAYYSYFTAASDGDRPVVVSYASSPPFEVIYATEPIDEPPTAVMTDGCFRQIEYAGIVAGTETRPAAEQVIDLLLSTRFQDEIPLSMFVFPANENAVLPPAFVEFAVVPDDPLSLPGGDIEANVRRWITEWTEVVTG
jgi:thiamine transport system substrate-binding protein